LLIVSIGYFIPLQAFPSPHFGKGGKGDLITGAFKNRFLILAIGGITTNLMPGVWADIARNDAGTPCYGREEA
jgi:hypothetical protein